MKKTVSILLAVMMIVAVLTGCGGSEKITRGVWNGTTFSNESTGIKLTVGDDWTISTDEELAEMMDVTLEEMSDGNAFSEAILKSRNIYDCMTAAPSGSNIIILYENCSLTGIKTAEEYLDVIKEGAPETIGLDCEFSDYTEYTLCGNTYTQLTVTVTGYDFSQSYLCRKLGSYMVGIIITVAPGDDLQTLLDMFG